MICCFVLLINSNLAAEKVGFHSQDLYLVLLIDGSSSMARTDPLEYRKMASQAIVSLLSDNDNVAIIEFSSDAVVLQPWTKAKNINSIFAAIDRVGHDGTTDFYLGLKKAKEFFEQVPTDSEKKILLFSDGEMNPNPFSDVYSPLHLEYRYQTRGKSASERHSFYREFRNRLIPIAKYRIDNYVLPFLSENEIEIFSVAFSPEADKEYLRYLSDYTSLSDLEPRFFYVEEASDIMQTFLGLLPFWQNKVVVYKDGGQITGQHQGSVFIDEFLIRPFALVLLDEQLDFSINATGKPAEKKLEGTHKNISIIPLQGINTPARWYYNITGTQGSYEILVIGESTIRIEVQNLMPRYMFGEKLETQVFLKIGEDDARQYLGSKPEVTAQIIHDGEIIHESTLMEKDDVLSFYYKTDKTGSFSLHFTLKALDLQGREILPRPSREYEFQVMPRLFVDPDFINFGSIRRGKENEFKIIIHNGLEETRTIDVRSEITSQSRESASDTEPHVADNFTVPSGTSTEYQLSLVVPRDRIWGSFGGNIILNTDAGEKLVVPFRLHVPSWKEKIGYFLIFFLIILVATLITLVILWGNLKTPTGILKPIDYPVGIIMQDIKLSRVKKGFWSKYLNWKRNQVRIGKTRSDILLNNLSELASIQLLFFRFGRDYIKNDSSKDSNFEIVVQDKDVGVEINITPGSSYTLNSGMLIKIGEYKFKYEI